jgi:hypothetical protein
VNTLPSSAGGLPGPALAAAEEVAAFVVAAAVVWAPSAHNSQPWWFSARGKEISLYADASRRLMVADPGGREVVRATVSVRCPPASVLFPSGGEPPGAGHE